MTPEKVVKKFMEEKGRWDDTDTSWMTDEQ